MARRVSTRRVKIHRQYTYDKAADALGVTPQTVRSWRREGLVVLDSQKPHLILGFELKRFLGGRAQKASRRLAPDEFRCMSCGAPRRGYGAMADYVPYTNTLGRLETLCEAFQTPCGKFVNPKLCAQLTAILSIVTRPRK